MRCKSAALLTSAALVLCAAALAQQPPSQQRGLAAATAYQPGDLDHVNLFNGQLTLGLPLGPAYPVSPALGYGLALRYSSNGWDSSEHFCTSSGQSVRYNLPIPDPNANAGFGWRLDLGKLAFPTNPARPRRLFYLSPDGGQHGLYEQLHPGIPAAGEQPGTLFTNDGSYLRLRPGLTPGDCRQVVGASIDCRRLELPNGNVHEFLDFSSLGAAPEWRLTRMRDAFGNTVDVDYPDGTTWELRDSHGRVQRLVFDAPAGSYRKLLRVELSRFGGGPPAVYTLEYRAAEIERQGFSRPQCAPAGHGAKVAVDLLARVIRPDGSFYEMDYYAAQTPGEVLSGGLRALRLPTGGGYRWSYQELSFISEKPEPLTLDGGGVAYGVATRDVYAAAGDTEPIGGWRYAYESAAATLPRVPGDGIVPCHHRMTVSDPLGNDTVYYFSTSQVRHSWSYGLPFTRCNPATGGVFSDLGPFLSQEIYEGSVSAGRKLRSIYVEYESDGPNGGSWQEKNHRLSYRKVVYHDDGDRYREVRFSDFDGLGHYRTATTGGDFGDNGGAGDVRRATTLYNPGRGTFETLDVERGLFGGDFRLPAADEPWVLSTYVRQDLEESGQTAVAEYCFDPATGFLDRQRVRAGSGASDGVSDRDLVTLYTPERRDDRATGFIGRVEIYGGDAQEPLGLGEDDLCTADLDSRAPGYELRHRSAAGTIARTDWIDADDKTVLNTLDLDVDPATGLPAASRDAGGVLTRYAYDALGRRVGEQPESGAWAESIHLGPTLDQPDTPPELLQRRCSNGVTGCETDALAWQRTVFDGLGRPVLESRPIPAVGGELEQTRQTTYDALGRKLSESAWGSETIVTSWHDHDRFGRPRRLKLAGQSSIFLGYQGERLRTRQVKMATEANGGQTWVTTTETLDGQGRLARVCENPGALSADGRCSGSETRYGYDVGGRLARVCGDARGDRCGQERLFGYDGRGFLVAERHPELGPAGNGWSLYTYDALGNVLGRSIEDGADFDLAFTYDRAGRLTRLDQVLAGGPRPLKELVYSARADLSRGKLLETRRFHWLEALAGLAGGAPAVVTDRYRYEGPEGAMSHKLTRLALPGVDASFQSTYGYDELGAVSTLAYPKCLAPCADPAPERTLGYVYEQGFLTAVPGFADHVAYQGSGALHQIEHANGVVETHEIDVDNGLERPHQISTDRGFSTGIYRYDGAGNIRRIGNQRMRYDALGRLLTGEVEAGGRMREQGAVYDVFGNLTRLTTDGQKRPIGVDPRTNRLNETGSRYDAAGNLVAAKLGGSPYGYVFDAINALGMVTAPGAPAQIFFYDGEDERVATLECALVAGRCLAPGELRVTLRGPNGSVLRTYERNTPGGAWGWLEDTLYRDGQLLATVEPAGNTAGEEVFHHHLDHLGSPRQTTGSSGAVVASRSFYPFGQETAASGDGGPVYRFTGHERDSASHPDAALDYLHARYTCPSLGRFMSFDPLGGNPRTPQSWNRYSYALNNPVKLVDPDGMFALLFMDLAFVIFDEITIEASHYSDFLAFFRLTNRFFNDEAPAGPPGLGTPTDLLRPAYSLVQALNGKNELEMVRFGLDPSIIDTGGVPEFAIFLPLGRIAKLPAAISRFLPTFERATVEEVVGSSRLMTGSTARGASLLRKRVADGALVGVRPSQANAEKVLRDVLGNPSRVRAGARRGQVDVIGESFGQEIGVRINTERGNLVGFRRPDF